MREASETTGHVIRVIFCQWDCLVDAGWKEVSELIGDFHA
jgi:hypothetical protein